MYATDTQNPFHEGEMLAQARAGAGDVPSWAGPFIRDYLPAQHRDFHTKLPFLVASGADAEGRVWATLIEGEDGFVTSPDARRLDLAASIDPTDPLAASFAKGTDIGVVGIELATRRRNRFSGHLCPANGGYRIDIQQTFGNCPQYIHERSVTRVEAAPKVAVERFDALQAHHIAQIEAADTLFIGTGHKGKEGAVSNGFDASHRGGAPGFVRVVDATHLQIPDYPGNNFFNTIGNLMSDGRLGLLFVEFETGDLLHLTGRATIDWSLTSSFDDAALRIINVEITGVVKRSGGTRLRWRRQSHLLRPLRVMRKVKESDSIASFILQPADGGPLPPFEAGQHLPIEVQIPGQAGISKRSYSLSGDPSDRSAYRLSIKREEHGLVSRFLHDELQVGGLLYAYPPSGDFVVPRGRAPLVLISAGVGLTPMVAVLHDAARKGRPAWFVHGARDGSDHALADEVAGLINGHDHLSSRIHFSRPTETDTAQRRYDATGRVTAQDVLNLNAGPEAHYLLCGPAAFLSDMQTGLEQAGISADRIHFETFGPSGAAA